MSDDPKSFAAMGSHPWQVQPCPISKGEMPDKGQPPGLQVGGLAWGLESPPRKNYLITEMGSYLRTTVTYVATMGEIPEKELTIKL